MNENKTNMNKLLGYGMQLQYSTPSIYLKAVHSKGKEIKNKHE